MKYKVGYKVKIVANRAGHNYQIGNFYKIANVNEAGKTFSALHENGQLGYDAYFDDAVVIMGVKELKTIAKELETEYKDYEDKIKFMEVNDLKEFDEKSFKAFKILEFYKKSKPSDEIMIEEIKRYL